MCVCIYIYIYLCVRVHSGALLFAMWMAVFIVIPGGKPMTKNRGYILHYLLCSGRSVTMDPPHADVRSVLLPSTIVLPVLVISDAGLGMGLRTDGV